MSKYDKVGSEPLQSRIEKLLKEHRYPQALELAKQLVKQEPIPAHQDLLQQIYLTYLRSLVQKEAYRDALLVFNQAEQVPGADGKWFGELALLCAEMGDLIAAKRLADKTDDPSITKAFQGRSVDRAIRQGPSGKNSLPAELHADYDTILTAFDLYAQKQDAAARELLQKIGLQSPFLEWKVLLRGLLAYSNNEDPKAVDNWSRLDPTRLPARLVAPMRFQIDRPFREIQPPETAQSLNNWMQQFSGAVIHGQLQNLRRLMASPDTLPDALKLVQKLVPEWKKSAPHIVSQLANVFYWAIVHGGQPSDLSLYQRTFGNLPSDPNFERLLALVFEEIGDLRKANQTWHAYIKTIQSHPQHWPKDQGERAIAYIWERMADNAKEYEERDDEEEDSPFGFLGSIFQGPPRDKTPLQPSLEDCLKMSMDFAKDWPNPARKLFQYYLEKEKLVEAEAVVTELLSRFPNDLETLQAAARLQDQKGNTAQALQYFQQALHHNPLDRQLRQRCALASFNHARSLLVNNQIEETRAALQEAISLSDEALKSASLILQCVIEWKAGHLDQAELWRQQALNVPNQRAVTIYRLAVESGRVKLAPKWKKPLELEWTNLLTTSLSLGELLPLLEAVVEYGKEPTLYRGQKTHLKKIQQLATKWIQSNPDESEMIRLGYACCHLKQWNLLSTCLQFAIRRFQKNPHFVFLRGEMELLRRPRFRHANVASYYYSALKLINETSNPASYQSIREAIDNRKREHPWLEDYLNPGGFFSYGFRDPFGSDSCDDEDL